MKNFPLIFIHRRNAKNHKKSRAICTDDGDEWWNEKKNKSKKRKGIFTLKVFLFPVFFFFRIEKYLFFFTRIFFSNWTIRRAKINWHRRCSWSKFAVAQCFALAVWLCARECFVVTTSINDFSLNSDAVSRIYTILMDIKFN